MANPVTHLEKTIAGEVQPVTHLEHVIAEYGGGGGGGGGFTPTTAQLAAMNSGITSEDVEQIETNKTNILLKQDALKIVDLKGTTKIDLSTLTWTQSYGTSGNGLFYTTIGLVSGISSIYCITVIGFGGIDSTSFFIPRTTNDGTGLMLMANNDFSTQTQAYIELRIVGI